MCAPQVRLCGREKGRYASMLRRCGSVESLSDGKGVHAHIIKRGTPAEAKRMHVRIVGCTFKPHVKVETALINMYVKCGIMEDAQRTFDDFLERDVVCWTALIAAYAQQGEVYEAFQLFYQMHLESIIPNGFTFASILAACANRAALAGGKRVHAQLLGNNVDVDIFVKNALLTMYSKCGRLKDAQEMFNEMIERDVVSWTAMIAAYAQHGLVKEAFELSQEMQRQGITPNEVTMSSILAACSHTGLLEQECIWMQSEENELQNIVLT